MFSLINLFGCQPSGSPCEIPITPQNGEFICSKDTENVNCTIKCKEGYAVAEGSIQNFYCTFKDGLWMPSQATDWPECSGKC